MKLGRTIRTTSSAMYIADKIRKQREKEGKIVRGIEFNNPMHIEFLIWYLSPYVIIILPLTLSFINPIFALFLPAGLIWFATSKKGRIATKLENLSKSCEIGDKKAIIKYMKKCKKAVMKNETFIENKFGKETLEEIQRGIKRVNNSIYHIDNDIDF